MTTGTVSQSASLSKDEVELFWRQVVPYFGLDESFDYDAHPSKIREYLGSYGQRRDAQQEPPTMLAVASQSDWRIRRLAFVQEWSDAVIHHALAHLQGSADDVLAVMQKAADDVCLSELRGGDESLQHLAATAIGFESFAEFAQFKVAHPVLSASLGAVPALEGGTGLVVACSSTEVVFNVDGELKFFESARLNGDAAVGDSIRVGPMGEAAVVKTAVKKFTNGDGNAVVILAAQRMGLDPLHVDDARRQLDGGKLHPMVGAAMEREAVSVNNRLRHDENLIALANIHAEHVKAEFGFVVDLSKEAFLALQQEAEGLGIASARGEDLSWHARRLQVIGEIMEASQWTLHPDYGCVLEAAIHERDQTAMVQRG